MTNRIAAAAISLLSAGLLANAALAYEPGVHEATRTGITLGVPAGAAPQPGLYMNLNTFFYDVHVTDRFGQNTFIGDNTASPSALLMWVPEWKFLGASFFAYAVQPYVFNASTYEPVAPPCPTGNCSIRNVMGFHNSLISPVNLSWNVVGRWFTSIGFGFYAPDGTVKNATNILPLTAGTGAPGLDFWTFQPRWAVSYLDKETNFTANLYYEINTVNRYSQYTSGNVLYGDFTFTKNLAIWGLPQWDIGPVAAFMWQTTNDSDPLGLYPSPPYDPLNTRRSQQIAAGGMVQYTFSQTGPKLNFIVTDDVYSRSTGQGWMFQTNLSFRLWGPEAPPPAPSIVRK